MLRGEQLGRAPSEPELYIAHFLGAPGAARLIGLAASNPNAKAADFFPGAAQANSPIFYDRPTGRARSLAQVRDVLTARYDVARARPSDSSATADADAAAPAAATAPMTATPVKTASATVPDTAGMTNAFASAIPVARQGQSGLSTVCFRIPIALGRFRRWQGSGPEILTRRFARKCTSPPLISWQPSQRFKW